MFFDHLSPVVKKQKAVFLLAMLIIGIGVVLGATSTELGQSALQSVESEMKNYDTHNISLIFNLILTNNVQIAIETWITGFVIFPTMLLGVESIGLAFGIYLNPVLVAPEFTLIAFSSFGLLELVAMIFAVAAGLMIPKFYVQSIRERKLKNLSETLRDGAVLIAYSSITLVISAFLEAFLVYTADMNPILSLASLVIGVFVTMIYFQNLFRAIRSIPKAKSVDKVFVF